MVYAIQKVRSYDLRVAWGTAVAGTSQLIDTGQPQYASPGSLVSWWRLNENVSSAGDVTDAAGDNPGTFDAAGDRPAYSAVLYPSSRIQVASNTFDGTDDGINVGTAATWDAIIGNDTASGSTQKMSFSAWVYKTGDGGGTAGRIFQFGDGDALLYTEGSEEVKFATVWNGSTTRWETPASSFSLNTWTHIVVTYDANAPTNAPAIYIGAVAQSLTRSGATPTGVWNGIATDACYIGNKKSGTRAFAGNLADVAVWNKVLTANEVSALYNAASYDLFRVSRNFRLAGSTFSITGAIDPFRQGINVDENKYRFLGLTPKITFSSGPKILFNGVDMNAVRYFDDSIVEPRAMMLMSGTFVTSSDPDTGEAVITEVTDRKGLGLMPSGSMSSVPNFEWENLSFGQPKAFKDDTPFLEMQKFDAVKYVGDDTGAMIYPYVGSNPGALDPYQSDGAIEPLYEIRASLSLMTTQFPFLARGVWGYIGGNYAIDSRRGGILITQQISNVTSSFDPYEDSGTEYFFNNANGSLAIPGFLTQQQSKIDPWVDDTIVSIHIKQLATGSQQFATAMEALSGANTQRMLKNHHKSAAAGFVYNNNVLGTDSLVYGGWKK
jgi:hypothetical protein